MCVRKIIFKIDSAIKEELGAVEWDAQLSREMDYNVAKVLQLVAQKIEQHLVLDSPTLQMSERLSTVQVKQCFYEMDLFHTCM